MNSFDTMVNFSDFKAELENCQVSQDDNKENINT